MKLATYSRGDGVAPVGIVSSDAIIEVVAPEWPKTMVEFIASASQGLAMLERLGQHGRSIPLASVRLLAPVPQPPEFLGVGLNYHDHLGEAALALPPVPTVFNKQTSSIAGPFDDVVVPASSDQFDYEGELGLVIGSATRNMTETEAEKAIFGYVVVNDLSVRDWQFSSPTVTLGKSFDTHGPFGPWIVTADEIGNPQNLALTTRVNGAVRQQASTADMIFSCRAIVAFLSKVMTLKPGTVVTTGTPAGVGHFLKPPGYLKKGDRVTVEIERIGQIANRVVAEDGTR